VLLEGKVAVVSGIGPGMGRDISLALAREGADLVIGARREEPLQTVAEEIERLGRRAVWKTCDVKDADQCAALVQAGVDAFGRIDILVNNAFRNGRMDSFEDVDLDDWRKTMDTNFFGTLQLTKAALPWLKEAASGGRVIMINSTSSQLVEENMGGYAGSKGALATVTQTLARELGRCGIRVNGIHPGYIWGPNVEWYFNHLAEERGVDPKVVYDEVADQNALKYIAPSAEIAGTVVFLASDLSLPITGQSINASNGQWMQ
jgi:NAD(P)-dependent dehydrogenase (short-subunit alcohol dehydrogenase family)